ncbi:winged helix-turn-helix domain-containing protein [Cellulomonas hominis]|uniref:ArsR/SmtB family transcription factor n=1 Tax=Cellulomonas hominis TaxID=156981 RepID=UPI001C1220AA|nr:winged helix-turn-helix domain-containing protein [Cellulomonas hominis]MBU5423449.1 winged helix-turn-helix domain-containing protein [Cellulomonas hominis]
MATDEPHDLADLEQRVARLEAAAGIAQDPPRDPGGRTPAPADDDPFWALNALREVATGRGAVLYTGTVTLDADPVEWQLGLPVDAILDRDWETSSAPTALAALGHPARLRFLQEIARGRDTVARLAELDGVGTTGQIYHHLSQLQAVGWVQQTRRGAYAIPPDRLVPLLTVVLAAGGAR